MNAYLLGKLKEKGWIAADADTSTNAQDICGAKLKSGELTLDEFMQWTADAKAHQDAKAAEAKGKVNELSATVASATASAVAEAVGAKFDQLLKALAPKAEPTAAPAADDLVDAATKAAARLQPSADPVAELFTKAGTDGTAPRVKKASEGYSTTKSALCYDGENPNHPIRKSGKPVMFYKGEMGIPTPLDTPSELEYAYIGAFAKHQARKAGLDVRMNEHEVELVKELVHKYRFCGPTEMGQSGPRGEKSIKRFAFDRHLDDLERKTILDSATSGGDEAVPEFFDNAIITTPLLYGELFPYVNVIPMSRGSSVDGFSMGNPTFVSTASGSGVSPFTTTSFIAAFDTTIFPATCAIELGLDWESDAVANFGATLMAVIGNRAMHWLDQQIAVGDGTTEPTGIFVSTGTAVSSANGTGGPLAYNDALTLAFGLAKEARNAFGGSRVRYVMNDTNYKHFMAIVTGVTGDTRPIFGMHFKDYMLGDYPVSVQNDITVSDLAFCNLGAYRMYRRQGLEFVVDETGRTNRLANTKLVLARMRWGGQLSLPTVYCAQMTDANQYSDLVSH